MSTTVDGELAARLEGAGQEHLVSALAALDGDARDRLEAQVRALDLDLVARLVERFVHGTEDAAIPEDIRPGDAIALPHDPASHAEAARARRAGEDLIASGRVALVLLAGGQGTRLGFDGPKGEYPFAPLTGRTLFHHLTAKVAALREAHGAALPLYILTSPANDAETRRFFDAHDGFGLAPGSVRFVVQGTLPAVDRETGRVLLDAPDAIALSPDGHGGLLTALRRSGALEEMASEGVETVFTFQVDNPMVRVAKPELLGHHALAAADMSSVVVRKRWPGEKLGVIATVGGRTAVVEYSDLPDALAEQRTDDGQLTYWAGSIAVHAIQRVFVERLTAGGPGGAAGLPFHRAVKKVPYVRPDGTRVAPEEPNAVKFETFIFDALPLADRTATVEAARTEEFSPIKNASGDDSPDTARRDLNRLYAGWLQEAGVEVPLREDGEPVDLEIDPRLADDAEALVTRLPAGLVIAGPTALGPDGAAVASA